MTDQSQPTVDSSGITRTAEGQIVEGQTTQTDQQTSSSTETTPPDGKTLLTEGKKDDVKSTDTKEASKGAPEAYEDYKLPDGFTLSPTIKTEADALFKGLGLSQEGAQSLVDFYAKQVSEIASAPGKAYTELTAKWREEAMSHPDLRGKLGPGQEVNVRIAKALDTLGDPKLVSDFKELMDTTGAGNNAAFIRVFDRFSQKITEGTHVAGRGPSQHGQSAAGSRPAPSAAQAMYPNLPSRTQ
jgi:hypothetical protein